MKFLAGSALFAGLILTSCGGNSEPKPENPQEEFKICYYQYNDASTEFSWTAFKTTAKKPVGGTFNEMKISGIEKSDDPKKLIESLSFDMVTSSVETKDETRNKKIAEFFFGTNNTSNITGKVKSLGDDGKATLTINMNAMDVDVIGDYTLEDGKFTFKSTIDVAAWNSLPGLELLNEKCNDLHSGEDGVSKTWQEVELSFSTILSSDCE